MILTMASSVAVYRAIKESCNVEAVIKWPNDLLVNGKKVCGILTELDAEMAQQVAAGGCHWCRQAPSP